MNFKCLLEAELHLGCKRFLQLAGSAKGLQKGRGLYPRGDKLWLDECVQGRRLDIWVERHHKPRSHFYNENDLTPRSFPRQCFLCPPER